jgi:hypothetical protein
VVSEVVNGEAIKVDMKRHWLGWVMAILSVGSGWAANSQDTFKVTARYAESLVRQTGGKYLKQGNGSLEIQASLPGRWYLDSTTPDDLETPHFRAFSVTVSDDNGGLVDRTWYLSQASVVDRVHSTALWTNEAGRASFAWSSNRMQLSISLTGDLLNLKAGCTSNNAPIMKTVGVHVAGGLAYVLSPYQECEQHLKLEGRAQVRKAIKGAGTNAQNFELWAAAVTDDAFWHQPVVTITNQANTLVSTNEEEISLGGTVAGDYAIDSVLCLVTTSPTSTRLSYEDNYEAADLDTVSGKWSFQFVPEAATNYVWVKALDELGNRSEILKQIVLGHSTQAVNLRIDGAGTVAGLTNAMELESGRNYTIRALPQPGSMFCYWKVEWEDDWDMGCYTETSSGLTFMMQHDTTITAVFTTNSLTQLKGNYSGLFCVWTNGVDPLNAGAFRATVSPNGTYSAKLTFAKRSVSFSGKLQYSAAKATDLWSQTLVPGIPFHLSTDEGNYSGAICFADSETGQVSGYIKRSKLTWYGWETTFAEVEGHLAAPTTNLSAATYNVVLDREALKGTAFGNATVSAKGVTSLRLNFPDKVSPITSGSVLGNTGTIPFFAPMYSGKGLLIGWLYVLNPDDTYRYDNLDVVGYNVRWFHPDLGTNSTQTCYTNGFTSFLLAAGMLNSVPKGATNLLGWTDGIAGFGSYDSEDCLLAAMSYDTNKQTMTFGPTNTVRGNRISLTPSTGQVSGTFTPNGSSVARKFQGIWMPQQGTVYGFYQQGNQFGPLRLAQTIGEGHFESANGYDIGWHPSWSGGGSGTVIGVGFSSGSSWFFR